VFELQEPREVLMKGLDVVRVREIYNTGMWRPMQNAEDRAKESLAYLGEDGRYWPRSRPSGATSDGNGEPR
jgi:hypothetical protein